MKTEEARNNSTISLITYEDFAKVDIRSGTIIHAEPFPEARKSAYKITVDFGSEFGVKQTSAQITENYTLENLIGMKVIGVLNLGEKRIAGFKSQFLLVGFQDEKGAVSLVTFNSNVPNGRKLH